MADERSKLVYSTDHAVPRRERPAEKTLYRKLPPSQQKPVIGLDRKGRGGKSVTVVEGLLMPLKEKETLLRQLKSRFGRGGTVTETGFEIQGDLRDPVMETLKQLGYSPKRSGG